MANTTIFSVSNTLWSGGALPLSDNAAVDAVIHHLLKLSQAAVTSTARCVVRRGIRAVVRRSECWTVPLIRAMASVGIWPRGLTGHPSFVELERAVILGSAATDRSRIFARVPSAGNTNPCELAVNGATRCLVVLLRRLGARTILSNFSGDMGTSVQAYDDPAVFARAETATLFLAACARSQASPFNGRCTPIMRCTPALGLRVRAAIST